jgi:hypothetical protein
LLIFVGDSDEDQVAVRRSAEVVRAREGEIVGTNLSVQKRVKVINVYISGAKA